MNKDVPVSMLSACQIKCLTGRFDCGSICEYEFEVRVMKENIGTVEYASLLYDFYGALLSENQLEVMTMYHEDNLSLSEIAEELGMTRQAVHYTLKKAERKLEEFDSKLGLVEQYRENQVLAEKAIGKLSELEKSTDLGRDCDKEIAKSIQQIREIVLKITE